MAITSVHPDYSAHAVRWERNRRACAGQDAVKQATTKFLPDDQELDISKEARRRYERYLERAVWMPVAGYTKNGLLGMVYRKPPQIKVPPQLEYMLENADGAMIGLEQFSKMLLAECIEVGRVGVLAEYPQADEGMSQEEVQAMNLQARLALYRAEAVDHWKFQMVGGILKLTMVKLCEVEEVEVDEFVGQQETRYRVLRLEDGVYTQTVYDEKGELVAGPFIPRQSNGASWDHIPFQFIGAETNRPEVDDAVISGIVDLNTQHYQVSADEAKNLHIHSGGTLVISSDLSVAQWQEANPNGVTVGADQGLFIGQAGKAELLQLDAAQATSEKLKRLEEQMLSIGAHLITPSEQETAEAARLDASAKSCALSVAADNVQAAMVMALKDCALFMGGNPDGIEFELNREYYPVTMTAQEAMAQIQLMDRGVIAKKDLRDNLRKAGQVSRTDEEIDAEAEDVSVGVMP